MVHDHEIEIYGYKNTSDGVILDFKYLDESINEKIPVPIAEIHKNEKIVKKTKTFYRH